MYSIFFDTLKATKKISNFNTIKDYKSLVCSPNRYYKHSRYFPSPPSKLAKFEVHLQSICISHFICQRYFRMHPSCNRIIIEHFDRYCLFLCLSSSHLAIKKTPSDLSMYILILSLLDCGIVICLQVIQERHYGHISILN